MQRGDVAGRSESGSGRNRGVAPLVGLVLLFGMVVTGAVLVALTGSIALEGAEEEIANEQSVQRMDVVRSGVEDVQYGGRERFTDVWATEESGTITFELNGDSETRAQLSMGAFLHESEAGIYASQLGGTWTETDSGSRMIHEPQLEHEKQTRGDTEFWALSVPPVEIEEVSETNRGDDVIAGYRPSSNSISEEMIAELDDEPLRQVTIIIEDNPYADAWARYLEDELPTHREDSEVTADGDRVEATAPLGDGKLSPDAPEHYDLERTDPPGAIATTADSLELTNAEIDSYDSADDPYDDHEIAERRHGLIEATGDVDLSGGRGNDQMAVRGDVLAGGSITGTEFISPGNGTERWDDYTAPESVSDRVNAVVADLRHYREQVDNDETNAIDGTAFDGGVLESGVYYLEDGQIDDDLEIDASDGDVVIAVDDDLTVDADVDVTTGDSRTNEVRWFVDGDVTVEGDRSVDVQDDRSPQHWVFGTDGTTEIGESASFTGVVYTPGSEIVVRNGNQNDPTTVYGGLVGHVDAATNAHFAYDRGLDRDPRAVADSGIGGPNHPFDAEITLSGADFGWSPQTGSFADSFDPFDRFDPGEYDAFDVDLPESTYERVIDPDGELEYFQTATGTTSETETSERTIRGNTSDGFLDPGDPADGTEIDVDAGETVTVTATDETTELSLVDPTLGELFEDELASGQGRLEVTVEETTTLELGVRTDEEREYELAVETHQYYEELTFEATEYDEFRVEVTSDDDDFFVELREDGEVMEDTGVLFTGDARWTGTAGETVDERYRAYQETTSFDGGEGTIRIGSFEGDEPIDYEVTLEQTAVDSSIFDLAGDPAWFQQFPIETELQFKNATETTTVQPWPETGVDDRSAPSAAHPDDVNHPAVDYPLTYEVENLSPGTTFAPSVTWRDGFCNEMTSYAGTWRTPDSGEFADETLFEMGCTAAEDDGFGPFDLFDLSDWFDDTDDPTELNRELNAMAHVDGGDATETGGERVTVLEDGDRVPDVEPFEAQRNLTQLLGDDVVVYNESADHHEVRLDPGEFVLLFELAPESYMDLEEMAEDETLWEYALRTDSDAPDFNDLVMRFEITDVHDDVTRFESGWSRYDALDIDDGVITAEDA